jgi:hypothetical protein
VIDIEQRALCSLEKDPAPISNGAIDQEAGIGCER